MKSLEGSGGAGSEPKPSFQGHNSELDVINHVKALQAEANFRGSPQPSEPNPAEQQASERLGKPPPKEAEEGEVTAKTLPEPAPQPSDPDQGDLLIRPMRPAVFGGHVRPSRERKPKGNHPKP